MTFCGAHVTPLNTLREGSEMHEPAMALDKVVLSQSFVHSTKTCGITLTKV